MRHPKEMGSAEVEAFLTMLANERQRCPRPHTGRHSKILTVQCRRTDRTLRFGHTASMLRSLFVDFNSDFASVEQQHDPALRGRPVRVVPVMADSSCCIAARVEAKALGMKSGARLNVWRLRR